MNALSLSPDARDWLANSRPPRILHIFDHACNLINERREVLSVVTQQIGNGPFNLVVEGDALLSDYLNLQSPVSFSTTQLRLGDLMINTADAKPWNPRPNWKKLHLNLNKNNILHELQITNYKNCGLPLLGLRDTPLATTARGYSTTTSNSRLLITNDQFFNSLISAVASADLPSSLAAAQKLAGLGQGLTPSGDDFITGALYAAWIIHPLEIASTLAKEIAETAAPLTTSLSAAWLRSAGKGEAGILWHDLFNALTTGKNYQLPITNLLAVGDTSGADALAGFIGTFISYAEVDAKPCPS